MKNELNNNIKGEAKEALQAIKSFEVVFILHLMNELMGITLMLCQKLQSKSQDILNALGLVRSTKILFQELRQDGLDNFLKNVLSFFEDHGIYMPDMDARYLKDTSHSCQQKNVITVEHYYYINIFNVVINFQLVKLVSRFPDQIMELLTLSSSLDPTNHFKSFNIDDIFNLVHKFYSHDFTKK